MSGMLWRRLYNTEMAQECGETGKSVSIKTYVVRVDDQRLIVVCPCDACTVEEAAESIDEKV